MSEEQLKAFLEKVKGDTSLKEKLNEAASPEAAMEIAKDAGFAITAEDIQSMQSATVEVSDEELEGAAGGGAFLCELLGVWTLDKIAPHLFGLSLTFAGID